MMSSTKRLAALVMAATLAMRAWGQDLQNPCLSEPFATYDFCDESLAIEERIEDMLSRMNVSEKLSQLSSSSPAVPSLGLAPYDWWSEATHGISHVNNSATTPFTSNFAMPITTAMSFNRSLWRAIGSQIGQEARAFMNEGNAYSTFWAPVVNLAREPRWGRNIETPGEDPYLTGQYAVQFVEGFEHSSLDGGARLQAAACCKHYMANSMERSTVAGVTYTRHDFNADLDPRDVVDSYMPPFEACVEVGKVSGLMCSYNAVDGVPACASAWLLEDAARDAWGHTGYVTSDCDAVEDVYDRHNYTSTPEEAVRAVLMAGTDVDCGVFISAHGWSAYEQGLITESDLDARLQNLLRVRMRLGHFDASPSPLDELRYETDVCTSAAKFLARHAVAQSCALLKNVATTLPIADLLAPNKRVAVIGPTAQLAETVAGYYGGPPCDGQYTTLLDAVRQEAASAVGFAPGVPSVSSDDLSGIPAAVELVRDADVVLLALGTDLTLAEEAHDAVDLSLSLGQKVLAAAVVAAARHNTVRKTAVVALLFTATPLDIEWLLSTEGPDAIVHVGQPSVQTHGIIDVLVGRNSPAGRLVQTWYPASFQAIISIFDMNLRPGPSLWPRPDCPPPYESCANGTNPGRTYRFYTGTPVLEFGYGLSYSSFRYTLVEEQNSPRRAVSLAPLADALQGIEHPFVPRSLKMRSADSFAVQVANTGAFEAEDVVLAFLEPPAAGQNGMPLKVLFGFERVRLLPGHNQTVWFYPTMNNFAFVQLAENQSKTTSAGWPSTALKLRAVPGRYHITFGLRSTQDFGMGFLDAGQIDAFL